MYSNLADHRVGGCVDESVLLWTPEGVGVGGLPGVNGGGGEGLGFGLHRAVGLPGSFEQLKANFDIEHVIGGVSNRKIECVSLVDLSLFQSP